MFIYLPINLSIRLPDVELAPLGGEGDVGGADTGETVLRVQLQSALPVENLNRPDLYKHTQLNGHWTYTLYPLSPSLVVKLPGIIFLIDVH